MSTEIRKRYSGERLRSQAGWQPGFTLVELMIVVAIVAIIAAFAYPSYRNSVLKSHRADAKVALTQTAQTLERCNAQYGSYDNTSCAIGDSDTFNSPKDFYQVKVAIPNPSTKKPKRGYKLTANARGSQTDDTACKQFTLDQAGKQTATNTKKCWQ